jgi:hypothetical protein
MVALSSYEFNRWLPFSEAVFGIAAAKFAAETGAEGVGEETDLVLIEPGTKSHPVMSGVRMDKLRKLWKKLPRFPKEAEAEVWKGVEEMVFLPEVGNNPFLKAFRRDQEKPKR